MKVGDKIICVKKEGAQGLNVGDKFTVLALCKTMDRPAIYVKPNVVFYSYRFRVINPQESEE